MTKPFKIFLLVLIGLPVAGALLTALNYLLVLEVLRINKDPLAEIARRMPTIARPLVLESSEDMRGVARDFLLGLGLTPQTIQALPRQHSLLIDLTWIARANPYPPLLGEYNPNYGRPSTFSLGYIGREGHYHQVTYYNGEADTTPSFLVRKIRGEQTHNGDYFVSYAVLLSKSGEPDPTVTDPQSPPTLDVVRWGAFRGGSYDGFEEILIPPAAALVEIILMATAWLFLRSRRRAGPPH